MPTLEAKWIRLAGTSGRQPQRQSVNRSIGGHERGRSSGVVYTCVGGDSDDYDGVDRRGCVITRNNLFDRHNAEHASRCSFASCHSVSTNSGNDNGALAHREPVHNHRVHGGHKPNHDFGHFIEAELHSKFHRFIPTCLALDRCRLNRSTPPCPF